jgi:RsiW-degrading membrane proteinase PrsW (M82 family)
MSSSISPLAFALAGGLLPALAWLWFWLREDSKHPEPRNLIALAFLAGMLTVAIVIPIQKLVAPLIHSLDLGIFAAIGATTLVFTAWSAIEEICKYLAARFTVLGRRTTDEPIDAVIYMVTVALGFAAVENALFLLNPAISGHLSTTFLTSDLRAIGATLLHIISSAAIGVMIALAWYRPLIIRILYVCSGVILAVLLHAGFNFLILNTKDEYLFRTFGLVWVGVIILLALLEYVKRMHRPLRTRTR